MRIVLGLLVLGSLSLFACSGDDGGGIRRAGGGSGGSSTEGDILPGPGGGQTGPAAAVTCPAGLTTKELSAIDKNAADIRIVGGNVVFRDGNTVVKVDARGIRSQLYASTDLVRSFSDADVIATIESPDPPNAVLKVMPAGPTTGPSGLETAPPLVVTPANWNAGGTSIFGSDATYLYVLADVQTTGDTIYKVNKANPAIMTQLANLENASLGSAQVVGSDVWFVREQKRVYKVAQVTDPDDKLAPVPGLPGGAGTATEVFGLEYGDCKLAVSGTHTFCSTGKVLEQRDLEGGSMQTVLDPEKSALKSLLGAALWGGDTVFVRSLPAGTSDPLRNGIRAVKAGVASSEKFVACGRETITSFAADSTTVVWTEQGKGVFSAPR